MRLTSLLVELFISGHVRSGRIESGKSCILERFPFSQQAAGNFHSVALWSRRIYFSAVAPIVFPFRKLFVKRRGHVTGPAVRRIYFCIIKASDSQRLNSQVIEKLSPTCHIKPAN